MVKMLLSLGFTIDITFYYVSLIKIYANNYEKYFP